jgi:hypothetical protein
MTYGIQIFGPSGTYVTVDTSIAMEGTVAVSYGSGTSVSYSASDILAIRKTVSSGTYEWVVGTRTVAGSTITMSFKNALNQTATSVNYVILRVTNNIAPSGTYGQVSYASNGTARVFDSRLFSDIGSFNITNVAPGGSYLGSFNGATLTSYNTYEYFAAGWFWNYSQTGANYYQGLQFANGHSTYGSTVRFRSYLNIFGGVSYPDLTSGTFWGQFV